MSQENFDQNTAEAGGGSETPAGASPSVPEGCAMGVNSVTSSLSEKLFAALDSLEGVEGAEPVAEFLVELAHAVVLQQMLMAEHMFINDLLGLHPDALALRADKCFHEWVSGQPPVVRACLVHSTNPDDAAWAISLYKEELSRSAAEEAKRGRVKAVEEKMRHAASPSRAAGSSPAASRFTRDDIRRMSVEEFKRNEEKINAALASGEID